MTYLEFLRRGRSLTQLQLAAATGWSQNTISVAERGARVEPRILRSLAGYFALPEAMAATLLHDVPANIADVEPAPDLHEAVRRARGL
jgi:transcriptional regulator with XRE-family HTH domain